MAAKSGYDLMHYEIEGDGPVVILLHGMSSSLRDWCKLRPKLVNAGYKVIAADLLGHGNSAKPADVNLYTTRAVYAVLEDWIDFMRLTDPFFLVGHSLGGYMSLLFALRNSQRLKKMVLLNPLFSLTQLSPVMNKLMPLNYMGVKILQNTPFRLVRSFLSWNDTFLTKLDQDVRSQYSADIKRADPNFLRIPADAEDLEPMLPKIPTPTLVIYGLEDHLEYPDSFTRLVDGLANGSGLPLPGCGHHPHLGEPELVIQVMQKFFSGTESN